LNRGRVARFGGAIEKRATLPDFEILNPSFGILNLGKLSLLRELPWNRAEFQDSEYIGR
jgi:hypothetical protein